MTDWRMAPCQRKSLPAMMDDRGAAIQVYLQSQQLQSPGWYLGRGSDWKTRKERERRRISTPNKSRLGIILPRIRKQTSPTSFSLTSSITTMAALPAMRQLGCLRSLFKSQEAIQPQISRRFISTAYSQRPKRVPFPSNLPEQFLSQIPVRHQPQNGMDCN
jgi:hypothetical protein